MLFFNEQILNNPSEFSSLITKEITYLENIKKANLKQKNFIVSYMQKFACSTTSIDSDYSLSIQDFLVDIKAKLTMSNDNITTLDALINALNKINQNPNNNIIENFNGKYADKTLNIFNNMQKIEEFLQDNFERYFDFKIDVQKKTEESTFNVNNITPFYFTDPSNEAHAKNSNDSVKNSTVKTKTENNMENEIHTNFKAIPNNDLKINENINIEAIQKKEFELQKEANVEPMPNNDLEIQKNTNTVFEIQENANIETISTNNSETENIIESIYKAKNMLSSNHEKKFESNGEIISENTIQNNQENTIENNEGKLKKILFNTTTNSIEPNKESEIKSENSEDYPSENTLFISERKNLVYLPYSNEKIKKLLKKEPQSTKEEIINKYYSRPMKIYKNASISRFKEAFSLMRNREHSSIIDAFDLGMEVFFNYDLHPAVISACRTLDELDVYLDYLKNGEIEKFKGFKVNFDVPPAVIKK